MGEKRPKIVNLPFIPRLRLANELFDSFRAPLLPAHAEVERKRQKINVKRRGAKRASPKNKQPLPFVTEQAP